MALSLGLSIVVDVVVWAAFSLPAWQMRQYRIIGINKQMTSLRPDYSLDKKERMRHAGVGINRQMTVSLDSLEGRQIMKKIQHDPLQVQLSSIAAISKLRTHGEYDIRTI